MNWYVLLCLALASLDSFAGVRLEWDARYFGIPGETGVSAARDVKLDGEGNVYVTGQAVPIHDHWNILTIKYDGNGQIVWQKFYEGPRHFDFGIALALDGRGSLYVTGSSLPEANGGGIVVLKYDVRDGTLEWARRNPARGIQSSPSAIAVDIEGDVFVAGQAREDFQNHAEFLTLKYAPDGTLLWERYYRGPYPGNAAAYDLGVDKGGNVYVTGPSWNGPQTFTWATLSYAPDGTVRWIQRYEGGITNFPTAIAVDGAGNSHVTGTVIDGSSANYLTVKYGPAGNIIWQRTYGGSGAAGAGRAVAVNRAGDVYVTGDLHVNGVEGFTTLQYSAAGSLNWARTLEVIPQWFDGRISLKLDPSGSVYISGTSGPSSSEVYATLKYNAEGTLLWEETYGRDGLRYNPYGLAVDAFGNAYVTGLARGDDSDWDWCTVKYRSLESTRF